MGMMGSHQSSWESDHREIVCCSHGDGYASLAGKLNDWVVNEDPNRETESSLCSFLSTTCPFHPPPCLTAPSLVSVFPLSFSRRQPPSSTQTNCTRLEAGDGHQEEVLADSVLKVYTSSPRSSLPAADAVIFLSISSLHQLLYLMHSLQRGANLHMYKNASIFTTQRENGSQRDRETERDGAPNLACMSLFMTA